MLRLFILYQELQVEMTKHMDHLKQLKDFDENISREKQAKAKEEQEKMRAQVSS